MAPDVYRYTFDESVSLDDVRASLTLAIVAIESLHGGSAVRLDVGHLMDAATRTCVIDSATVVGKDLNKIFTGFLLREFGAGFRVRGVRAAGQSDAAL